jgi:hypothetical protein
MRPTLLLIHGIGSTRAFWDPIVARLERDFTCVAIDAEVRAFLTTLPPEDPDR